MKASMRRRYCTTCRDYRHKVFSCMCGKVFCEVCSIEGCCIDCGTQKYWVTNYSGGISHV